jgi:hypothetical protein
MEDGRLWDDMEAAEHADAQEPYVMAEKEH